MSEPNEMEMDQSPPSFLDTAIERTIPIVVLCQMTTAFHVALRMDDTLVVVFGTIVVALCVALPLLLERHAENKLIYVIMVPYFMTMSALGVLLGFVVDMFTDFPGQGAILELGLSTTAMMLCESVRYYILRRAFLRAQQRDGKSIRYDLVTKEPESRMDATKVPGSVEGGDHFEVAKFRMPFKEDICG